MGYLRINKVVYSGQKYHFESQEFNKNIVVIEGDNGTGKSTLFNLIYYGLGGEVQSFDKSSDVKHLQITSDLDNYVDLFVTISRNSFVLRRYIGDNDITITPYTIELKKLNDKAELEKTLNLDTENTLNLKVNRNVKNDHIFSDWILDQLGIAVVELFHGYSNFKVNFNNLLRLIYHDQQPDPENIYKKLDNKSALVADSEVLRKAIFELLIGKSYSDYYDAIVNEKRLAKEKSIAKSLVDEYSLIADKMRKSDELKKNTSFLNAEIKNQEARLEKLHAARLAFKNNRSKDSTIAPAIEATKSQIITNELSLSSRKEKLISLLNERQDLESILTETQREISQIQKVIFSHDQLNLFTADTCPYCLGKVERAEGHCVCGSPVEEERYERFFYTSQEYKEILRAKIKTLKTIKLAYDGCNEEITEVKKSISVLENKIQELRSQLEANLNKIDQKVDIESLNDIDDRILDVREEINNLYQLLEIETKLKSLQDDYDAKRDSAKKAELYRKGLEVKAQLDITDKVKEFSNIYNRLVVDTLPECRSARIKLEDYLPSINEGEYREASSRVSIRLMYYLTLMHLSLKNDDVSFPKFLMIDTPETAGIELKNLINCISKFEELDEYGKDYQVILATGLGKYPESLKDNRVLFMPSKQKQHMLLREVN